MYLHPDEMIDTHCTIVIRCLLDRNDDDGVWVGQIDRWMIHGNWKDTNSLNDGDWWQLWIEINDSYHETCMYVNMYVCKYVCM